MCFYPQWESVRTNDDVFPNGNKKIEINPEELQNKDDIDFKYYFKYNFNREFYVCICKYVRVFFITVEAKRT